MSHLSSKAFRLVFLAYFFMVQIPGVFAQADSNLVVSFDFNDHSFDEKHQLVKTRPKGVTLVEDRFGNDRSAVFINGTLHSYLNLGTEPILKAKIITVSLWFNIDKWVYAGKGDSFNPIFMVKNGPGDDFYDAYCLAYNKTRFCINSTKDSISEAILHSINAYKFGTWYHLVFTADNKSCALYVNGKLQGRCEKDFETRFLESDSVVIGHSANKKNERFSRGTVDDIRIFHRVLGEKEIMDLYNEPNPNKNKVILLLALEWLGILAGIFLAAFLMIWRRRRVLMRVKEKLEINRKLHEMEVRTLKAQMNPHFIFNSLNSIRQFIMLRENEKAETYLLKFSNLMRDLLESSMNESLTVKEEIEILNGYLDIESLRFGDSFSFSVKVSGKLDAEGTRIPHLMIQPFVENAIWHGLLPKKSDRRLSISFEYNDAKTLLCLVDDNGIGRESSFKKRTVKKKSLALGLVKQRLELMKENLGVNCRVDIIDKKDANGNSLGTLVTLILPIITA